MWRGLNDGYASLLTSFVGLVPDGSVRFVIEEVEVLDGDRDLDGLADADARSRMESADGIGRARRHRLLHAVRIAGIDTRCIEREVHHDLGAERLEQR